MARYRITLDDFRTEPNNSECYEACWSQGQSCAQCLAQCYRHGWPKKQVEADNAALVNRQRRELLHTGARP